MRFHLRLRPGFGFGAGWGLAFDVGFAWSSGFGFCFGSGIGFDLSSGFDSAWADAGFGLHPKRPLHGSLGTV